MNERRLRSSAYWAAVTTALFFPYISITLLAICTATALILILRRGEKIPNLALAAILVAGVSLLLDSFPTLLWYLSDRVMKGQGLVGIPVQVDPSLFVSRALIAYALCGLVARDFKSVRLGIWTNLILSGLALLVLGIVAPAFSISCRDTAIAIIILWGVNLAANWLIAEKVFRSNQVTQRGPLPLLISGCALASAVLAASVQSLLGRSVQHGSESAPTVAVFEPQTFRGGREFGKSSHGFGLSNIGLYGDMSEFLDRLGYRVKTIDSLTDVSDINASCLYCPSFPRPLTDAEVTALRGFLESGGSLIAVVEHTNLEGCADNLNPVIKPYGLVVKFDNTNGLFGEGHAGSWSGGGELADAVRGSLYLTHNRGASIRLASFDAAPVLTGRFWQCDRGDSLYPDRAYLSDGRLSPGDRLGNAVLMAEVPAGNGRIFLSGDSSPFLNQNLAYNAPFLSQLFATMTWQGTERNALLIPVLVGLALMLGLVGLVGLTRTVSPDFRTSRLLLGTMSLLVTGTVAIDWYVRTEPITLGKADWAIISTRENNVFDRDSFSGNAATGLALQIFRSGKVPVITDWARIRPAPRTIFILNPAASPSKSDRKALNSLVEGGAHLVFAGDGDNGAFTALAASYGFVVTAEPVGSLSDSGMTTYSAWRVERLPAGSAPIAVTRTVIGGTVVVGAGKVTVIADGGFLLSRNLETETTYDEENCHFVRSLIDRAGK